MDADDAPPTTRDSQRLAPVATDAGVVAALTALAVYTRYRPLSPPSLFLDDAWVSVGYRAHGWTQIARTTFTSPLFSLATDLWLKVVGLTSMRAQMLAFVAGIVAPAIVYAVARSMRLGRAAAILAGALLLFAPFHILYSTRVKQYSFDALLTTIMLAVAWRCLDTPSTRRYVGVTVAAIAVSFASIAVAPVVAGAYASLWFHALRRRTLRLVALASTAAYGALAGTWYFAVVRPASHASLRAYWIQAGGFWTDDHLRLRTGLHLALSHIANGFSTLPPTLTIALLALATITAFVRSAERALLLVVPGAVALALSAARVAPVGARVDVYLYPTFAILAAYAAEPLLRRSVALVVAPIALIVVLLVLTPLPSYYPSENIAPLVARLEADACPTDPVLLYRMGLFGFALYTRWPVTIARDSKEPVPFTVQVRRPDLFAVSTHLPTATVETAEARTRTDRLWFIGAHGTISAIETIEHAIQRDGYRMVSRRGDHGAWLDEFVRIPAGARPQATATA